MTKTIPLTIATLDSVEEHSRLLLKERSRSFIVSKLESQRICKSNNVKPFKSKLHRPIMDNTAQQKDEIEALNSIYGSEWKPESESDTCFSMQVSPDVKLFLTLNPEYPSESPPTYQMLAPSLSRSMKDKIKYAFEEVYLENIGGPVLFQWIERLKEIIFDENGTLSTSTETSFNHLENSDVNDTEAEIEDTEPDIIRGSPITDRKSTFQAHACSINNQNEVQKILDYLLKNKKIAQATHNILAYRISTPNGTIIQDFDDDGESHAGGRLLHLLQILNIMNVMVVVSRWYGGIHLGPDRFRHINNAARLVLQQAGLIKSDK